MSKDLKYIVELKNNHNTDNHSSRLKNYDKLIKSIEMYPNI